MLYNKLENTYILDVDDAILLYGKKEYNKLRKSGDLSFVTMQSLKPQKEQKSRSRSFAQGKTKTSNRTIMCIETGEVFDSIQECCLKYGYHVSNICAVCKGKQKSAYGYHWRYT